MDNDDEDVHETPAGHLQKMKTLKIELVNLSLSFHFYCVNTNVDDKI